MAAGAAFAIARRTVGGRRGWRGGVGGRDAVLSRGHRGPFHLRLVNATVLFVGLDDFVFRFRRLGAWFGSFDFHFEAFVGGGRVLDVHLGGGRRFRGLGPAPRIRRHDGTRLLADGRNLVGLLYVRIQVDDQISDAYIPLVVIVFEVRGLGSRRSGVWLRRGVPAPGVRHPRSVARFLRAGSHWGRHALVRAPPPSPCSAAPDNSKHCILSLQPQTEPHVS